MMSEHRKIRHIASEICQHWKDKNGKPNVHFAAKPYLQVMLQLDSVSEYYGFDTARSIINYFLCNASSFRGEHARRLKAELKAMLK
jgi:hypothetical protein